MTKANGTALEILQSNLLVLHVYAIKVNRTLHTSFRNSSFMHGLVTSMLRILSSLCNRDYFLKYQHENLHLLRQAVCMFLYTEK